VATQKKRLGTGKIDRSKSVKRPEVVWKKSLIKTRPSPKLRDNKLRREEAKRLGKGHILRGNLQEKNWRFQKKEKDQVTTKRSAVEHWLTVGHTLKGAGG